MIIQKIIGFVMPEVGYQKELVSGIRNEANMKFHIMDEFICVGLGGKPVARMRENTPLLSPKGQQTYKVGIIPISDKGQLQGFTINCCEPIETVPGQKYVTGGSVWVAPYVSNGGFISYSITCETLLPWVDNDA